MPTIDRLLADAYSHWDDAEVLARTGRELHDRNRLDHAKRVLARSLEIEPNDPDTWAHLGYAHLRSSEDVEGCEVLRRGIEATNADSLRATLMSFISDEEEQDRLRTQVAKSDDPAVRTQLRFERLWAGEMEVLDEVRGIRAEHPENEDVRDSFLWMLLGAKNSGKADDLDLREEGVPLADRRISEDPDRIGGHWMKVQLLLAEKDWDGVLAATGAALERIPDDETMMHLRGRALKEKGDPDRAAECLARAIGMKPSFAGARVDLGKIYESRGDLERAEEIFLEIPVANPGYVAGPLSMALFMARQERWEEAEDLFLETWPKLHEWNKRGIRQNPDAKALLAREAVKRVIDEES